MNRKDFFRGILGTAVMASLPAVLKPEIGKPVFDQKRLQERIDDIYKDSIYRDGNGNTFINCTINGWEQTRALCNKLQK